jgi:hypothetical protein
MTLNEKINDALFYIEPKLYVKKVEKIADEFAIGFAEWVECSKTYYTPMNELLEIYKREKGL